MDEDRNTKPLPRKVRGVATISADYGVTFRPYAESAARKEDVKKVRQSSLYTTQGEKQQSRVCHLTVDASAEDPVGEMLDDFVRLTKSEKVKEHANGRGRKLVDKDGLLITANKKRGVITTSVTIDINQTPNYEKAMFNYFQEILKCFTINQTYLRSLLPVQGRPSQP